MIELLKKFLISLVVVPFIICALGLVLCIVLTMPLIALIRPDVIKLGVE